MSGYLYPVKFSFSIGSYTCNRELIQWDGKKLIYQVNKFGGSPIDRQRIIIPKEIEWQRFWTAVRNIGVWYWREKYDEICVCDGVEWKIDFAVGDKRIKSEGCGAYPPNSAGSASEAFKQLLRALGELINDQEFIRDWYYEEWD
jgi:hypothetical protein